MDDDSWSFGLSTSYRSYQSSLKHSSDICIDFEDNDGDDDLTEYPCPFCGDYFDLVGLCCHIDDEHPVEANYGDCPVCDTMVATDMVGHITTQHHNIFTKHKLKPHKGESYSSLSSLRKELQDAHFQSLLARSSSVSSSKTAPDPLLSFICNMTGTDGAGNAQTDSSTKASLEEKGLDESTSERNVELPSFSNKVQTERAKRCEFVQGLLFSTILEDIL